MAIRQDIRAIAARIARSRKMKGLGSRELARLAKLSEASISRIEKRKADGIEVETVFRIADALRVDRGWLVTGVTGWQRWQVWTREHS